MKKLFLLALLVVGTTTFAQKREEKREQLTPEQQVELQVKRMKLELDLNDKQIVEVKKIMSKQIEKREAKKAELKAKKAEGQKPTADERFALKNQMLDEQIAHKAEMKKILTADQFSKWEQNRDEAKSKMKSKMKNRKMKSSEKPSEE